MNGKPRRKNRSRRSLGDEAEALVLVNRDHNGNDHSLLTCGTGIEFLRELYDVDTVLTESGTYRRSRGRFRSRNL